MTAKPNISGLCKVSPWGFPALPFNCIVLTTLGQQGCARVLGRGRHRDHVDALFRVHLATRALQYPPVARESTLKREAGARGQLRVHAKGDRHDPHRARPVSYPAPSSRTVRSTQFPLEV